MRTIPEVRSAAWVYYIGLRGEGLSKQEAKNRTMYAYGGREHLPPNEHQEFWDSM